jgi:hypothetical protein
MNNDSNILRAETCREYSSYLIKYFINFAKQKVLLFTVNISKFIGIVHLHSFFFRVALGPGVYSAS